MEGQEVGAEGQAVEEQVGADAAGLIALERPRDDAARQYRARGRQCRLKNWTARSCACAASRVLNVPRLRRFPVLGFFLRE
jgi:hypothetical protein